MENTAHIVSARDFIRRFGARDMLFRYRTTRRIEPQRIAAEEGFIRFTVNKANRVDIRSADTLAGLNDAKPAPMETVDVPNLEKLTDGVPCFSNDTIISFTKL